MRGTRLFPTSLVALSLAIAIPASAVAQQTSEAGPNVAVASGSMSGPARWIDPSHEQTAGGQSQYRERAIVGSPFQFEDERLSGLLSFVANGAEQHFADGWAGLESRTYLLTNEDGSWSGTGPAVMVEGPDGMYVERSALVLEGEGAYEGLIAYVNVEGNGHGDDVTIEGIVLENELAPAPAPISATGAFDISGYPGAAELDDFLTNWVGDAPGGVAAVLVRDGKTTAGAVGIANEEGDPIGLDTAFRTGSVSQMFIAAMVLQMADEGLVDLDAPLATYLPETRIGADVTVRQLLSQRSGIAEYVGSPGFFDDLFADPEHSYSPDEILDYVVEAPAGEVGAYNYSNTDYILLGQLVEAVDGTDLESALQARIAEPLGLTDTTYDVDRAELTDRLAGVWGGPFEGQPWFEAITSSAWAAGGLVSTPDDLATFLAALFDGEVVNGDLLAQMLDTTADDYGLGIAEIDSSLDVGLYLGQNGGGLGYQAFVTGHPENGDLLVLMSNSDGIDTNWGATQILGEWVAADA